MTEQVVDIVKVRASQREAWEREWPFKVELLPTANLFADVYQREIIESFVADKVKTFDPTLVGTIDVSSRSDGRYAILDGLQRSTIVERVGMKAMWCSIYADMGVKEEAEFFFRKNRDRRNMHPFYALRARMYAGEVGPKTIFKIVEDTGFKLGSSSIVKNSIVAIGALESIYAMSAPQRPEGAVLRKTLETVREAYGEMDKATEGTVLKGIGIFHRAFLDDEVQWNYLIDALASVRPTQLLGYAADKAPTSRNPKSWLVAEEVLRAYNKGQRREKKLSIVVMKNANKTYGQR